MTDHLPPLPCSPPERPPGASSMLLDPLLGVAGAEASAIALIQAHPGLLALRLGRLELPRQPGALAAAAEALRVAGSPPRRGLALHRPGQPPLTLVLERASAGRLWLHLMDGARPQLDAELLRQMFGLTAAELRVALLLAQGLSCEDIATRLHVQGNTVRGHVKQLLAKTHARRQAQLVGWLWRSAAVMLTPPAAGTLQVALAAGVSVAPATAHCQNG